jgi:hypothetical protein
VENFIYRLADQLATHEQDSIRDYHRAYIFYSAVTERVLIVGGLICQTEADERDGGRASVREVVRGVMRLWLYCPLPSRTMNFAAVSRMLHSMPTMPLSVP